MTQGSHLLVLGASGAVGRAAVQIAVHTGAEVSATASELHHETVLADGASRVIDHQDAERLGAAGRGCSHRYCRRRRVRADFATAAAWWHAREPACASEARRPAGCWPPRWIGRPHTPAARGHGRPSPRRQSWSHARANADVTKCIRPSGSHKVGRFGWASTGKSRRLSVCWLP